MTEAPLPLIYYFQLDVAINGHPYAMAESEFAMGIWLMWNGLTVRWKAISL